MKFADARHFALSLPEVAEAPHHHMGSFRVRGKIFVTVPPEQTHLHLFVSGQQRDMSLALYPQTTEKLLWGGKVVGIRLALAPAKAAAVKAMVQQAWMTKAPKALAAAWQASPE